MDEKAKGSKGVKEMESRKSSKEKTTDLEPKRSDSDEHKFPSRKSSAENKPRLSLFAALRKKFAQNQQKADVKSPHHSAENFQRRLSTPLGSPSKLSPNVSQDSDLNRRKSLVYRESGEGGGRNTLKKKPSEDGRKAIKTHVSSWVKELVQGGANKIHEEWDRLQRHTEKLELTGFYSVESFIRAPKNRKRYQTVVCWDRTRVRLKALATAAGRGDFIHANYLPPNPPTIPTLPYILAQGPTTASAIDFWSMIWQEKVGLIVMLTKTQEANKEKCMQYWPWDKGILRFTDQKNPAVCFTVKTSKSYLLEKGEIRVCKLTVSNRTENRFLFHYHYLNWPDHSVPASPSTLLTLQRMIYVRYATMLRYSFISPTSSVVVHCSAGIGRTGVFVAIDMMANHLTSPVKHGRALDMYHMVKQLRCFRALSVQTEAQYFFCYEAVMLRMQNEEYGKMTDIPFQLKPIRPDEKLKLLGKEKQEEAWENDRVVEKKLETIRMSIWGKNAALRRSPSDVAFEIERKASECDVRIEAYGGGSTTPGTSPSKVDTAIDKTPKLLERLKSEEDQLPPEFEDFNVDMKTGGSILVSEIDGPSPGAEGKKLGEDFQETFDIANISTQSDEEAEDAKTPTTHSLTEKAAPSSIDKERAPLTKSAAQSKSAKPSKSTPSPGKQNPPHATKKS